MSLPYCAAVLIVLWKLCPISEDVGGPVATFFCANCPTPTAGEFNAHYWELIWPFATPYFVAALYLTVLSCGLAPRLAKTPMRIGWVSCGLVLLLAVIVDVGGRAGIWNVGSRIFVWDDWIIYMEAKTILYVGATTAVFAYLKEWLIGKGVGSDSPTPSPPSSPDPSASSAA